MSFLKKIGKKIIKTGFEVVKEGGEQVGSIVSPDRIVAQVTGREKSSELPKGKDNEFGDYLQNLGPNLTEEQLKQKIAETKEEEQEGISAAEKVIRSAIPPHMKLPPKPKELPIYDKLWQEREERKKAMAIEAQKKPKSVLTSITPTSVIKKPGLPVRGQQKKGMPEFRDFKSG